MAITITEKIEKLLSASVADSGSILKEMSNTDYADAFKTPADGYKIGGEITINREAIYDAIDGYADGVDITGKGQAFNEDPIKRQINSNPIVAPTFTDVELTQKIDEKSKSGIKRLTKPVGKALKERSEKNGFSIFNASADNTIVVETAPADGYKGYFGKMKVRLIEAGSPEDDVVSIIDEAMMIQLSSELENKFNPVKRVNDAFDGKFYSYNDITFGKSNRVSRRVNGAGGTAGITLTSNYISGADTMVLSDVSDLVVGDKIELTGSIQLNQASKDELGRTVVRAVRAIDTVNKVITISPIHCTAGESRKNIKQDTIVATQAIAVLGTAGKTYRAYPVYSKSAWCYTCVEQPALDATEVKKIDGIKGYKVRYASQADVLKSTTNRRAEMLEMWFDTRSEFMGTIEVEASLLA